MLINYTTAPNLMKQWDSDYWNAGFSSEAHSAAHSLSSPTVFRKLPLARDKYTTLQVVVPKMGVMEDVCQHSRLETISETIAYSFALLHFIVNIIL